MRVTSSSASLPWTASAAPGSTTITYQVDGGSSQTINGTSGNVTIPAPADGSNDGTHTIAFYATDDAGNVEAPAKTATVKIDATKPSTSLATTPVEPGRDERLVPADERAVHP